MRGRVAAGLAGTAVVLLVWAAGRGGDEPATLPIEDVPASATSTPVVPGHVVITLADDDEETPDVTWEVDLATATGSARSALCGPSGSFHLAVVDRTTTPLRGLRLSTVSPWTGPGQAAVTGQLLPAEGVPVDVTGSMTVRVDGEDVDGEFALRDDGGDRWTGTFGCSG
jgi:hypothetical protein